MWELQKWTQPFKHLPHADTYFTLQPAHGTVGKAWPLYKFINWASNVHQLYPKSYNPKEKKISPNVGAPTKSSRNSDPSSVE